MADQRGPCFYWRWLKTPSQAAGGGSHRHDCTPSVYLSSHTALVHCRKTREKVGIFMCYKWMTKWTQSRGQKPESCRQMLGILPVRQVCENDPPQSPSSLTLWERKARSVCLESVCWWRRCHGPHRSSLSTPHSGPREEHTATHEV